MRKFIILLTLTISVQFSSLAALIYDSTPYRFNQNWPSNSLFDLNNDGVDDIKLGATVNYTMSTVQIQSYGTAQGSNAFAQMSYGQDVNAQTSYSPAGEKMLGNLVSGANCTTPGAPNPCYQPGYPNVSNFYIGIKFFINGQLHYGWIELSSPPSSGMGTVPENWNGINKIVYNDQPNTPVTVGTITTSTIAKIDSLFKVYPNPTTDQITIASDLKVNSLEIYDASGIKVASYYNVSTLSIATLPKGIYTFVIKSEDKIVSKLIIKE